MSDLGAIVKDASEDVAEGAEKAGGAIVKHFGDIGDGLKDSSKAYRGVESDTKQSMEKIYQGGAKDAETAAGNVGKDTAKTVDSTAKGGGQQAVQDTKKLASETQEEEAEDAHLDGEGGETEDPVDVVTGEMFLPQRDLALPGVLPLVLDRRHGSNHGFGRLFGSTWSSTLDQRIQVDENGIHYAAPDGRVLHYPIPTVHGQRVMPSHGARWPLSWDRKDDVIRIEQGDLGRTLHFPPGPVPTAFRPLAIVTDRAGNRITFTYNADAVPTDIYHSGGYHIVVDAVDTRGGYRVSALKLADPAGGPNLPIRAFRYDMAGRLIETFQPESTVPLVFEYDESDRITRWVDRNGFDYRYFYREDGRVSHAAGSDGFLDVRLDYDLAARTTTETNALGHASVYHWNERQQTVKVVDPRGGVTLTEKDKYGEILSGTDPLGRITRIERNQYGDASRITRPDGSELAVAYDERRQPVAITEPGGALWRYEFGGHGALTVVTDPCGAMTRYGRDELGRLTEVADPLGNVRTVLCNKAGQPVQITDPLGGVVRLRRDPFGRIVEATDALGATTRSEWDREGRLRARTAPDGARESWEYDGEGNLLAHTGPSGAVTRYEYGPFDLPTARIEPDGAVYRFAYDKQLRLAEVTNPQGRRWTYEHDAAGNLVAETDFNGARRTYAVDAAGQLTAQEGAAGQRISFERDLLGRVVARTAGEALYQYEYDAAGCLRRAQGPDALVDYARDGVGRIVAESSNGRTLASSYDAAGQRVSRTTPGGVVSAWDYDPAGLPIRLSGSGGNLGFRHDAAGREVERYLGPGALLSQSFDQVGRLATQGIWAYDQRSAAEPAPRQLQARIYSYRTDGLPLEVQDAQRGTSAYNLDPVGRVTAVQAATWREAYAYDSLGNLAEAETPTADEDATGPVALTHQGTVVRSVGRTRFDHDPAGRITRQTRRTLSGQVREWTYTWDADDRLVQVTTPQGTWRYTYDPLGRRIAKTRLHPDGTDGESIGYAWDGTQLAEEMRVGGDGRVSTLTWDYEPETHTPLAQTRRTWADAATQAEIDTEFHAIVTDLVGRPTELVTPDGHLAWAPVTTLWGQTVASPGSTADCPLRFPGQYHDPETGLHYNYQRYYDPATASYLTPDPLGLLPSPNDHGYVENPLAWLDPLGLAAYTDPGQQVPFDSPDELPSATRQARLDDDNKGNLYGAVKAKGQVITAHSSDAGHAEKALMDKLAEKGLKPEDVDEIYTEYGMCPPCQGVGRPNKKFPPILPNLRDDVKVSYSIPFADPASRAAARVSLAGSIKKLFSGR